MASASLMSEVLRGKSVTEIDELFSAFLELVTTGTPCEKLGKLMVLAGVREFPVRVKCATLAWHTLKAALNNDAKPVSTEDEA
jgi:nitrogen fixation NifU-like protein